MDSWQDSVREAAPYLSLGMQLALCMVAFVGAGYALDLFLGTLPWLLLLGGIAGMACVIARVVYIAGQGTRKS